MSVWSGARKIWQFFASPARSGLRLETSAERDQTVSGIKMRELAGIDPKSLLFMGEDVQDFLASPRRQQAFRVYKHDNECVSTFHRLDRTVYMRPGMRAMPGRSDV